MEAQRGGGEQVQKLAAEHRPQTELEETLGQRDLDHLHIQLVRRLHGQAQPLDHLWLSGCLDARIEAESHVTSCVLRLTYVAREGRERLVCVELRSRAGA